MEQQIVESIRDLSVKLVPFVMAVVFHEYAHAFVANLWGDSTAKEEGRLTMNPIPHIDIYGTLVFPILFYAINVVSGMNILFGWAKPVPIDPSRFRKFRPGLFWVSFAGPATNFALAILSAFVLCAIQAWVDPGFYLFEPLSHMASASVSINFAFGIFNLIPFPPLDGSKMVEAFLPFKLARKYEAITQYRFFILIPLLMTGAFSVLSKPIFYCTQITLILVSRLFGF